MAKNTGKGSRAAAEQNRRESDYIPSVAEFRVSYRVTHADLDSTESIERADAAFERGIEQVRASERAKRPDREKFEESASREYPCPPTHNYGPAFARREAYMKGVDAVLSSFALQPETDQELQDRIEVLEKNLAYEVAQKIKLAEQLQAATTTSLTLEQARWKMHAGIDSRCSEEVAAKAKPVIDLVFSSFALEPEARDEAEYFRDGDGDLWKLTDNGEWFHEEDPGEFRQVLSIDAEDQTLTPVGRAELAPAPDAHEEKPPVYLASDLWSALRLPDAEFDGYYERNGWADTWSNLLAEVRLRSGAKPCGRDADGEPCVLITESHLVHYGASDVGSSEPLPAPEAREIPDAEVAAAYSAFVQASFGFPGAPAMRAALEAAAAVTDG